MAFVTTRLLLVMVCGFAALSSSAAAALGLENERIFLFTGLVTVLLLLPFLVRPTLVRPSGPLVALLLLLAGMGLLDAAGRVDPLDYKVALPVLVLLAAPNLARHVTPEAVERLAWRLLSAYVALTFLYQLLAEPEIVARGYEGIVRYDPIGSVVMHSSLSLIHLLLAVARLGAARSWSRRLPILLLAGMSLTMVLLTATRTALVTGALFALLSLAASAHRMATLRRLAAAALGFALVFSAHTLLVSDSFYLRLTGGQEDFSSGRWTSIRHWLQLAGDQPWGLGLGTVREMLAEGRPALDGTTLLEWPHNEFVRFFVEAGPLGLLLVALLLALLVRRAVRAAREADPVRRTLLLAIAADLLAEAALQNLFNAVYHATVLILILCLAAADASRQSEAREKAEEPGQAAAKLPSYGTHAADAAAAPPARASGRQDDDGRRRGHLRAGAAQDAGQLPPADAARFPELERVGVPAARGRALCRAEL